MCIRDRPYPSIVVGNFKNEMNPLVTQPSCRTLLWVSPSASRFKCSGWGMIQLYLYGLVHGELRESHTNHNSERRAQKWGSTYPELGDARDWDFRLVNSTSRKVNQFIKANSIANCGSRPIMKSASQFFDLAWCNRRITKWWTQTLCMWPVY